MGNVLLHTQNCSSHLEMLASESSGFILGFYCLVSTSPRAQNLAPQLLKLPPFWAGGTTGPGPAHDPLEDLLASSEVSKLSYLDCPQLTSILSVKLSNNWPILLLGHRLYHLNGDGFQVSTHIWKDK